MEASTSADHESTSNTSEESVLVEESQDFMSPWHFSDVVLVVEDTKFHVHKSTLSMWSPVFEAMFTHQFKESTAKEIPLPGKRADEVKELLKVIYSSWSKPEVTDENYQFLLQLADEYQMDRVKRLCSEFLVFKIQEPNCLEFFKLAEKFGLDDVTEECYGYVCLKSSDDLEGSEHFNCFEPELKVDICMKIIKELERKLREYALKTCSDLVKNVYNNIVMKNNFGGRLGESKDPKEHIRRHKLQNKNRKNAFTKATKKRKTTVNLNGFNDSSLGFEFLCPCCIEEIQQTDQYWNDNDIYSILKSPLTLLHIYNENITLS